MRGEKTLSPQNELAWLFRGGIAFFIRFSYTVEACNITPNSLLGNTLFFDMLFVLYYSLYTGVTKFIITLVAR